MLASPQAGDGVSPEQGRTPSTLLPMLGVSPGHGGGFRAGSGPTPTHEHPQVLLPRAALHPFTLQPGLIPDVEPRCSNLSLAWGECHEVHTGHFSCFPGSGSFCPSEVSPTPLVLVLLINLLRVPAISCLMDEVHVPVQILRDTTHPQLDIEP